MVELELYHITCKAYPIGKVPPLEGESLHHLTTQTDVKAWINDFLDLYRSNEVPSRKKTFFACDSIMNCKALKSTVAKANCTPRIYKVKMKSPSKLPLALVNHLFVLGQGHTKNIELANEYWNPTKNWNFYEYLSEEMEIIEEVINEDLTPMGQVRFWVSDNCNLIADSELVKAIFVK